MRYRLSLFALLLLNCLPGTAEIYKCTDKDGAVQYTDKPCAGHVTMMTPDAAPEIDAHVVERRRRTDKLLRAYEEEHAEEQRTRAEAAAALQKRRQECVQARSFQSRVTRAGSLYRVAEDGSRVDLNDAERAALLAKARADVARWCD
jgi:hypothetical protein